MIDSLDVRCPVCQAPKGESCRSEHAAVPHKARRTAAARLDDVNDAQILTLRSEAERAGRVLDVVACEIALGIVPIGVVSPHPTLIRRARQACAEVIRAKRDAR